VNSTTNQSELLNSSGIRISPNLTLAPPPSINQTVASNLPTNADVFISSTKLEAFVIITSANVATVVGESEVGSFVVGRCVYNPNTNFYEYQASIQALTPGNYRLSFGYNSFDTNLIEFRSESFGNNLSLNIESSAASILDGNGYYKFTVKP